MGSYDVFHEIAWGAPLPVEFFLAGIAVGAFLISAFITLTGRKEYDSLSRLGAVVAPLLFIVAPVILIFDLEQPARFWELITSFNVTSAGSWGVWFIALFFINSVLYLINFGKNVARTFAIAGIPLGLLAHGYAGYVLNQNQARALWNTALMPWLFLVAALISGIALVSLLAVAKDSLFGGSLFGVKGKTDVEVLYGLGRIAAWGLLVYLGLIFTDVLTLAASQGDSLAAAKMLLSGSYATLFWVFSIVLGAVVPLFILFSKKTGLSAGAQALASILILVGAFTMRYIIVIAGQKIPL